MINITMDNNNTHLTTSTVESQPNETGALHIQGHIKIFDPATKEVLLQKRA